MRPSKKKPLPNSILLDLASILAYVFAGDKLHESASRLIQEVETKDIRTYISEVTPYEAEALFLSGKVSVLGQAWNSFAARLRQDPLFPRIPVTPRIFSEHLSYYGKSGRGFTYFDSYHLATCKVSGLPIVTSDRAMLSDDSVESINLADF